MAKRLKFGDKVKFAYWTEDFSDWGVVIGISGDEVVVAHEGRDDSSVSLDRQSVKKV
jgi:hypothetical protein